MSRPSKNESGSLRASHGFDQFVAAIQGAECLSILDLSGASQANISFITSFGHRLYSEDFLQALDDNFGGGDFFTNQQDPDRMEAFLNQTLDFPEGQFQGALVWDMLQYLAPPLLQAAVERIYSILSPQACLLAFFNADERSAEVVANSYRIADAKTLHLTPRGRRTASQFFNSRSLERLFQKFDSKKFFLTRDHLREVIVRR